ncbi:Caspase-7 [Araneus ventricosus]|uniref:Caspase-7 n=1 Tax=Araneus ventricosus TaxID=182803 RepID=A0A4Y2FWL1_ARAVE|nr:Caspase-7 [Araneus ventricosus]
METNNKLHVIKPVLSHWVMKLDRRCDVVLTRLRIGHTRLTHKYLLFEESPPTCSHCGDILTVKHILTDCVAVNRRRLRESKDSQKKEYKEGECHIFNYQEFNRMAPRMGSEKDATRLKHDFTQLNLDVHLHLNLSYAQTFDVLKEASIKDHSKKKYFICCFLTHGSRDLLWAKDKSMHINDILKIFSGSSSLEEIPKIFIFQACRGKEAELGVSTDSTDSGFSTDTEEDYLDFLVINSTYLDTVSFKTSDEEAEKAHGSFFIDEFCRSLEQFSRNLDLLQISTIVNLRMATNFLSHRRDNTQLNRKKQMPCFTSTLRKKVKFNRDIEIFDSSDTQYFDVRRKRHGFVGHKGNRYAFRLEYNGRWSNDNRSFVNPPIVTLGDELKMTVLGWLLLIRFSFEVVILSDK